MGKNGSMQGKVCLVTGATSGIGEVAALELARMGAAVVLVGRSPQKCQDVKERIRRETSSDTVDCLIADLSVQAEVRQLAQAFKERYKRLDVLLNNAGAWFNARQESTDGIEMTFALNHLNYFLLTHLLLDLLKASAPARIINVSSGAHERQALDFDDLQAEKKFSGFRAYGRSKLANVLFTYELARRLEGSGVTANALHPGFVATGFGKNNSPIMSLAMSVVHRLFALTPEQGARTLVYLASSPEVEGVTGKYFVKEQEVGSSPQSYDLEAARRLWEVSEEMTGLK